MYTFAGIACRHRLAWIDTIASEWISAGGLNPPDVQLELFGQHSDADLASECLAYWRFDHPLEQVELEQAFARIREITKQAT